jgi:hypothetical protein
MPTFLSGGVSIRLQSYEPTPSGAHPALILFHGAGGNVDHWLRYLAPAITRLGIALYAVHYFDRTKTQRADPALIEDGIHVPSGSLPLPTPSPTSPRYPRLIPAASPWSASRSAPSSPSLSLPRRSLFALLSTSPAASPNPGPPAPPQPFPTPSSCTAKLTPPCRSLTLVTWTTCSRAWRFVIRPSCSPTRDTGSPRRPTSASWQPSPRS